MMRRCHLRQASQMRVVLCEFLDGVPSVMESGGEGVAALRETSDYDK